MKLFSGLFFSGILSNKKRIFWEIQLFSFVRSFKDGITFLEFKKNLDLYKDDHSPAFQIEFTILNCYNHIWIYQNNYNEE